MNLRYLLGEHLRGPPWRAIQWHNRLGEFPLDVVRVGDPPDLPLGTPDPDTLGWAEGAGRILVSRDRETLASHLAAHLSAGRHSPGIFLIRRHVSLPELVSFLVEAAYASEAVEWADRLAYIPRGVPERSLWHGRRSFQIGCRPFGLPGVMN